MPEGGAGELFDPTSVNSLGSAIKRVVYSPIRTQELCDCRRRRLAQLTWECYAAQTIAIYLSLVGV